jgi:hypothetical protein
MQMAALRKVYANISSESVRLTRCTRPVTEGVTASVECTEQVSSRFRIGGGASQTSRATFSLRRDNDRWLIVRIARAR